MPLGRWILLVGVGALAPAVSHAQTMDDPECEGRSAGHGPVEVTPSSGSSGATLGAPVRVRFTERYFETTGVVPEESMFLMRCDDLSCASGAPVTGAVQVIGDVLVFQPDDPFEARTTYSGLASGIDFSLEFQFTTGGSFDAAPPQLGELDASSDRVDSPCFPDGAYRIDVRFRPAVDDGPGGDIEYLLYLTRGPEVEAPELRDRIRNFPTDRITMAFVLEPAEAVSPVCVTVHAIDGVGRIDDDAQPVCFDPIQGNFFEPMCTVSAPGAARGAGWSLLALPALLWLARRRAWRRRR